MSNRFRAADSLVRCLMEAGTDTVFSLSGNQIMSIYDAAIDTSLRIVHARHESGAVFMADGYSRASDKVGVALVTAAPGFANALGAVYPARQAQTPLLLLSGDSPRVRDGMGAFQELDQPSVSRALVKESWRCDSPEKLPFDIAYAIRMARSGRPGPVHLALPEDLLTAEGTDTPEGKLDFSEERAPLVQADIHAILSLLEGAKRPLILTGPSLSGTGKPGLAQKTQKAMRIPVLAMQSPRGLDDPSLGDLRAVLKEADCIVLIDKEVDFTLGFGALDGFSAKRIALVAADAETIAKAGPLLSGRLEWGCIGDPESALTAIAEGYSTKGSKAWFDKVLKAVAKRPPIRQRTAPGAGMPPQRMLEAVKESFAALDETPILVIDGGEFGQWAQSVMPAADRHINGLSGSIGGSIPQAVGAAMANPGRRIIAFMGDGTAGFHFMEIEIARKYELPVTFIIGNDYRWGSEVEIQKRQFGEDRVNGCMLDAETRYDRLAEALGADGFLAKETGDIEKALKSSFGSRKPTVVNAIIEGLPAPSFQ